MAKKKKQKTLEVKTITEEEIKKLLEQGKTVDSKTPPSIKIKSAKEKAKKKESAVKTTRTSRNQVLYQEEEKKEAAIGATKQQKFNFEENDVEDEMDSSFISPRKKKTKAVLVEEKVYPKGMLVFFGILLLGCFSFLGYHFLTFDHNKVQTVTKTKKIVTVSPNYLFLGDSITDFYDLEKYFPDEPVVNSGISGNTTEDILKNMKKRVYQYNPSKVFLLIGTNDLLREKSPDEIFQNIKKIIESIKTERGKATIYVESIYPVNSEMEDSGAANRKNEDIQEINEKLYAYCKAENIEFIDMYKLLQDENRNLKEDYTKDGLHLNDEGYKIVTKKLKEYLKED